MHWMIFGDVAVNMARVELMTQQGADVVLLSQGGNVTAKGVRIDDILTALAAGQSRVAASAIIRTEGDLVAASRNDARLRVMGTRRFREPIGGNDPQAMRSIGRG